MRTIIVRLFEPAPDAGQVPLHGVVEDVRTGTTRPFRGQAELLAAITRCVGDHRTATTDPTAETCWP